MPVPSPSPPDAVQMHIICERDVGLFSLIQQVIANIPWAIQEHRIPIAYFREKTCYWTPNGYHGRDTVWEYYFEPLVADHPASSIPPHIRSAIAQTYPRPSEVGYFADEHTFVSNHFGDHPALTDKTLFIPYLIEDPDTAVRRRASVIIHDYVHPRAYVQEKADQFFDEHMNDAYVIGVHVRGTDAASAADKRWHRQGSLQFPKYVEEIERHVKAQPDARIFVATDAQSSLDYLKRGVRQPGARLRLHPPRKWRGGRKGSHWVDHAGVHRRRSRSRSTQWGRGGDRILIALPMRLPCS